MIQDFSALRLDRCYGFAEVTEQNIGKAIAIYVDDEIVSALTVQTVITGGEAVISGMQSYEEFEELVDKIYQSSNSVESE